MRRQVHITTRMFTEAAIQLVDARCRRCGCQLESVWLGEDEEPTLYYVQCTNDDCRTEHYLCVAFVVNDDIPDDLSD